MMLIWGCMLLDACDSDINDFDVEKDPLKGMIGGQDWTYVTGNAQHDSFANSLTGLIMAESKPDPCAIRVSNEAHLAIRIPALRQSINLPYANNQYYVIFSLPNGTKRLTASGGFIEVVAISTTEMIGYISADFDDGNTVKGAFRLEICN